MAKRQRETDGGKSGSTWPQVNIQAPGPVISEFRQAAALTPPSGIKRLGTAGLVAILGMPEKARQALLLYVDLMTRPGAKGIDVEQAWRLIVRVTEDEAVTDENVVQWFWDRILDPQISLSPEASETRAGTGPSERQRRAV